MARRTRTQDPQLRDLLASASEADLAERLAAARKFELAATWAEAHPAPVEDAVVDELGDLVMFGDQPITLAGEGAPGMSEFAVAEFAAAVGMSAYQGRNFLGAALEAKYRLPQIWAKTMAGQVPVWKVRRVTDRTHRLNPTAAAHVDRQLAPVLATCSWVKVEAEVETAAVADPEHAEGERLDCSAQAHLDIALTDARLNRGLVPITGLLEYTDAMALDAQIKAGAHALLTEHPELDLDTRRAMAAGHLGPRRTDQSRRPRPPDRAPRAGPRHPPRDGRRTPRRREHPGSRGLRPPPADRGPRHRRRRGRPRPVRHHRPAGRVVHPGRHPGVDPARPGPLRRDQHRRLRADCPAAGAGDPADPEVPPTPTRRLPGSGSRRSC
ncbi:hypothetical protein [Nocardioides sp. Root1257]|uniref:hypothetical protein n=1 Tax=Nocardioides sp. Root1257 TaxID=1736439 RepID=UPI000ADBC825|nr:hypothetical protein [Nocardioides sp. Root1257]